MNEKQKILIVDDKKDNLEVLRRVLREVDAEVVEANNGNEALAATLHNDFALGLLDVQMPGMSGFELAEHIRGEADKRPFPIVFLTAAYDDEPHMFKGYEAGGVDYITKPYSAAVLLAKVRIFLELDKNRRELEMHRERLETLVDERTHELRRETSERERAETAQKTAESRYSELFSRMQEGFAAHEIICDKTGKPVDYRFLEVNLAFERFTGLKREDIINRTALEVRPDTKPGLIEAYGHVALTRKTIRLQDIEGAEGKLFSVTVFSPRPGQFVTVLTDITEWRRAEEQVRASEAKYRSLVETTGNGYLILDFKGRVIDANAEYVRLSGHKELKEILGRSVIEWTADYEKEKNAAAMTKCAKDGYIRDLVIDYVDGSGKITPVEINATVERKSEDARIISLCRDITGRKLAEDELRRSELQLRESQVRARLGSYVLDIPSGLWTSTATLDDIFGIGEAYERSVEGWSNIVHPADRAMMVDYFTGEVAGKAKPFNKEYRIVRQDTGAECWVHGLGGLEYDAQGHPLKMHGTIQDITERKQAERTLIESEVKYRRLFESSRDALMTLDPPLWRFTSGNRATLDLFGAKTVEEFDARTPGDLSPEFQPDGRASAEKAGEMIATALREGSHSFEWTSKRLNGEEFPSIVMLTRIELEEKQFLQATVRDITGLKASEAAILESKNLVESVVENVPLMIFMKEAKELRFVLFNRAGEELLGYERKDLLGKNDLDFFPPEQASCFIAKDREVLDGKAEMLDIPEEFILTAKKETRVLHTRKVCIRGADGTSKYLLGISEDITERRQSEAESRENFEMQGVLNAMLQHSLASITLREKLKSHLEVLFGLPWLAIQPKGAVFIINPKGGELSLAAQQGLSPQLLEACSAVPPGRCLCGKAAQTGQIVETTDFCADHQISHEGIKPHGHYCVPIIAGSQTLGVLNLYLAKGGVLAESQRRFIKHASDIMAENIIHEQTEAKLLQSQKMESVGQLAGGVAHDFNNILTAIKCYGEFVRKNLEPQDPKMQDVKEILTAADRAVALTRQLLAFSRRQIMAPKVTDMNKCVADMTNMLRRLIGEDMSLATKLAHAPCMVLLDTGQIEQVMANLVVNARDAMPGGGTIELSTEVLEESEGLSKAHPELRRGPLVRLMVRDTGTGMTAEVKKHIFEPFFTTKEQGKGTGLGLSTVFGIVKQSGGDIEVESEPGKGTQFRIFFPFHKTASPEDETSGKVRTVGVAKGGETVLLVEDEESLRRLAKRVLETSGYVVLAAADGAVALREIERYGKPVDLLLTDVVMPGMTGRELARELAKRKMAGRTLYMSGYTDDAILKHGVLEENLAFIYKPFTVEGLAAKVRTVLDAPAGQAKA